MMLIRLSGKASQVWWAWEQYVEKAGWITLGELKELAMENTK